MSEPAVLYETRGHVAEITLNRPENRNSMTADVLAGLRDSVARVKADPEVRCLIITGRGSSFCAGADFRNRVQGSADGRTQLGHDRSFAAYSPFLSVLEIEIPVIAAMNGHAVGGGLGLALVCDLRVANESSRYGANFVRLGLHPGMATTYLMPRLIGVPRAVELLLTGRIISGAEASALGLAHYAEPAEKVLDKARELAEEIASAAPIAVRLTKQTIYRHLGWDPVSAARYEAHVQSRTGETEDNREGIAALLEKRTPKFTGR